MFGLAVIHAMFEAKNNRLQRFLMIITLFVYGFILEYMGVMSGNYDYASEPIMLFEVIPLSVTFSWVGIIYSVMLVGDRLKVSPGILVEYDTFRIFGYLSNSCLNGFSLSPRGKGL